MQKRLPSGLRQLAEDYVRQRDGHPLPDRATHPGRRRQPDGSQTQHEPAGGERAEPGGVALPKRTSQRESDRVWTQA